MDQLDRLLEDGHRSLLGAELDDPPVPPRRLDHGAALGHGRRGGLLDVDVLARLAAEDRHQRVPVIGRGGEDRVDVLAIEHAAEVLVALGGLARELLDHRDGVLVPRLEAVADGGDLAVGVDRERLEVPRAHPAAADHAQADLSRSAPAARPVPDGGQRRSRRRDCGPGPRIASRRLTLRF